MKEIKPDKNGKTKCIHCDQVVYESDEYYWSKEKGKFGKVNFIHKTCYKNMISQKKGSD